MSLNKRVNVKRSNTRVCPICRERYDDTTASGIRFNFCAKCLKYRHVVRILEPLKIPI